MRRTLQDNNHHVIGYIDIEFSGRQTLRDSNNHVLGHGNLLTTLL